MKHTTGTMAAEDGTSIHVREWQPTKAAKAVVLVAHGMAEHSARYERLAERLTGAGYAVYAVDHRGHGETAGSEDRTGYLADRNGWNKVVGDLVTLTQRAKTAHPGKPVFLLGHSWGSMLARAYAIDHGDELAGLVLSGTGGDPGPLALIASGVALIEGRIRGRKARSTLLDKLSFGAFNDHFKPNRTGFDWLSRDEAEVDKYIADPYCGFVCTAGFFGDLLGGIRSINNASRTAKVPSDLPVHLIAGDRDPVGDMGKGVEAVAEQFRKAKVRDVTVKLYPGARHEIFNETNRDEVMTDLVEWLDQHV